MRLAILEPGIVVCALDVERNGATLVVRHLDLMGAGLAGVQDRAIEWSENAALYVHFWSIRVFGEDDWCPLVGHAEQPSWSLPSPVLYGSVTLTMRWLP